MTMKGSIRILSFIDENTKFSTMDIVTATKYSKPFVYKMVELFEKVGIIRVNHGITTMTPLGKKYLSSIRFVEQIQKKIWSVK